MMIPF